MKTLDEISVPSDLCRIIPAAIPNYTYGIRVRTQRCWQEISKSNSLLLNDKSVLNDHTGFSPTPQQNGTMHAIHHSEPYSIAIKTIYDMPYIILVKMSKIAKKEDALVMHIDRICAIIFREARGEGATFISRS